MKQETITLRYAEYDPYGKRRLCIQQKRGYVVGGWLIMRPNVNLQRHDITHIKTGQWLGCCLGLDTAVKVCTALDAARVRLKVARWGEKYFLVCTGETDAYLTGALSRFEGSFFRWEKSESPLAKI